MSALVAHDRLPRRARPLCYLLIGLVAFCALTRIEWWPLGAFELFSRERSGLATRWEITLVDPAGTERTLDLGRLPPAFRKSHQLLAALGRLSAGQRDDICQAFAEEGARRLHVRATEARVYRVVVARAGHDGGFETSRRVEWTCAGVT